MDVGSEYIKMCEKAKEVQDNPLCESVADGLAIKEIHRLGIGDFVAAYFSDWDKVDKDTQKYIRRWRTWIISESDILGYAGSSPYFNKESRGLVWLPTQSQLQEMVRTVYLYELIDCFTNWYDNEVAVRGLAQFDNASMEQLWLAFVMFELYSKKWSKGEWVNE